MFKFSVWMTAYVTGEVPLQDKGYCVCQAGDISLVNLEDHKQESLRTFFELTCSVEVDWQLGFITIQIQ